jgi:excisionase family DNA binding protein
VSALRLLLFELLDVAERDEEIGARLRALVAGSEATLGGDGPRFFSVADVVERSGLSDKTVRRAVAAGELPASKTRGRLLIGVDDFDAWTARAPSRKPRHDTTHPRGRPGTPFAATLRSRGR